MRSVYSVLIAVILACVFLAVDASFASTHALTQSSSWAVAPTKSSVRGRDESSCQVCTYAVENKQRRQPYLCRGLKDPKYQQQCVRVLEALMWWNENQVYWMNYGCQREVNGVKEWIRPCPSAVICSWIRDFETRDSFCPSEAEYPTPL